MTARQLSLFDAKPERDCVRDGPCKTCGATRPPGYPRHMFLEPVSLECFTCNHATVAEILRDGSRPADREAYERAWVRHYPPIAERFAKARRRP
jgi:hypothetical protein